MDTNTKLKLLEHLLLFVNDNKKSLFQPVLNFRTRHITVVLEDIYQSQNASAVVRSCDIYGIQDLHVIENKNRYTLNPNVAMGAGKWVNLYRYDELENNTFACLSKLKNQGYKLIATSPHADAYTVHNLSLDDKIALCFGTELTGLSELAMEMADAYVAIPMYGFTESFNISASVAVSLSHLKTRLHETDVDWKLGEDEQIDVLLDWSKKCLSRGEEIQDEFLRKRLPH